MPKATNGKNGASRTTSLALFRIGFIRLIMWF
jgi:hypothetical protein